MASIWIRLGPSTTRTVRGEYSWIGSWPRTFSSPSSWRGAKFGGGRKIDQPDRVIFRGKRWERELICILCLSFPIALLRLLQDERRPTEPLARSGTPLFSTTTTTTATTTSPHLRSRTSNCPRCGTERRRVGAFTSAVNHPYRGELASGASTRPARPWPRGCLGWIEDRSLVYWTMSRP